MKNVPVVPFTRKSITSHPTVMSVATAATGFMRQMAIKPFTPRKRRREFLLINRLASPHASLIFHHHCYNPPIEAWYDKLQAPLLFAAV